MPEPRLIDRWRRQQAEFHEFSLWAPNQSEYELYGVPILDVEEEMMVEYKNESA
jgi:hypothetical protein